MPAGSRRSRRDARHAGAWRWLPLALVACMAEDGSFWPVTLAAVQRFQRAHRLPADGVVGRTTWGALVSYGRQRSRSPAC